MEGKQKIEQLFSLYLADQCSQGELKMLEEYFNIDENENLLKSLIKKELESSEEIALNQIPVPTSHLDEIFQEIKKRFHKGENN